VELVIDKKDFFDGGVVQQFLSKIIDLELQVSGEELLRTSNTDENYV